ncbi:MAG: hypothetical protein E6K52_01285 [Gammaproteobacteria bacterium]|nr:MAG: hypothetical protein E6K52_01285 [Gammaproteobacteria bacterium]
MARGDQAAQAPHRLGLQTAPHVAAQQLGELVGAQLRQQPLTALQISEVQAEAPRIQMVEERDDLLLRAAHFQRVDDEQQAWSTQAHGFARASMPKRR